MPCSSNIHLSHVNTSYGGSQLVQSLNIFVLVSGNPQQNTSAFGGNDKSGLNEQGQCIVWIPLQCGVPDAKRANCYSTGMVITCKIGESPSNGAPSKVDISDATEFKRTLIIRGIFFGVMQWKTKFYTRGLRWIRPLGFCHRKTLSILVGLALKLVSLCNHNE